jgi:hypothetical protein
MSNRILLINLKLNHKSKNSLHKKNLKRINFIVSDDKDITKPKNVNETKMQPGAGN